jgi:hypothetical protein
MRNSTYTFGFPIHNIEAFPRRTVPHGGFAAIQDDIAGRRICNLKSAVLLLTFYL